MRKPYLNSINYASCEAYLWDTQKSLLKAHPFGEAERICDPLAYWLRTGRASALHLKALFCVQPWRVAKVLERFGSTAPIDDALNALRDLVEAKAKKIGLM